MSHEGIYDLIERLNVLWEKGFHIIPGQLIVVKSREFEQIIDKIDACIPVEIQDAHLINRRKEEIIQEAQMKAERIVYDANTERHRLLSESEQLRALELEAQKIKQKLIEECEEIKMKAYNEAETAKLRSGEEAMRIREGAEQYARQVLNKLEQDLGQLHQIVMNGQQYLSNLKNEANSPIRQNAPRGNYEELEERY